jgi:hypothetical protein
MWRLILIRFLIDNSSLFVGGIGWTNTQTKAAAGAITSTLFNKLEVFLDY